MNNLNNLTQGRKKFVAIAAAGVVFLTAIGIGNAAYAAGTMAGSARADYGAQSYAMQNYGPRQLPNVQQYAQNDGQPAPQQFDTYRQSPQVAGPGWQRGMGGFGFFGGILRLIGTVFFIGFVLALVRGLFFRRWGFPGGMRGRGPWSGSWTGPWNRGGNWGGPGQGNSGVPQQPDDAAPSTTTPAASESKPQNPDAL